MVYVYKVGEPHTLLDGYPKPLKEELGLEGPVDAAFVCQDHHIAHIVKGNWNRPTGRYQGQLWYNRLQ